MSHLDDTDDLAWLAVVSPLGAVLVFVAVIAAIAADSEAKDLCASHGEKYVDSRIGYTLCEQDGGTVVRR